jgi:hypothetical protein
MVIGLMTEREHQLKGSQLDKRVITDAAHWARASADGRLIEQGQSMAPFNRRPNQETQDSTVSEPCSAFHSFRVLWLPPLVSTTSPVCGFL